MFVTLYGAIDFLVADCASGPSPSNTLVSNGNVDVCIVETEFRRPHSVFMGHYLRDFISTVRSDFQEKN